MPKKSRDERVRQAVATEAMAKRLLKGSGIITDGSEQTSMYEKAKENMRNLQNNRSSGVYNTPQELAEAIISFWEWVEEINSGEGYMVPDIDALCSHLCISRKTLNAWEKHDTNGFRAVIEQAKNDISACLKQLGFQNKVPNIPYVTEMNNNYGYVQKTETVITPNDPLGDKMNTAAIMSRYMGLIEEPPEKKGIPDKLKNSDVIEAEVVEDETV